MKTPQELLRDKFPYTITHKKEILELMQRFAEQQAKAFGEWLRCKRESENIYKTTDQLYQEYIKDSQK